MPRVSKAKPHLTIEEIKGKMSTVTGCIKVQKWLVILHATVDPSPACEIAAHVGLAPTTVNTIISDYNRLGVAAIETIGKGGRRNENMSMEEEKEFLLQFNNDATKGAIATTAKIQKAYEEKIGKEVPPSTIYRLLDRHKWRKIVPRSKHPKGDKAEQEAFKKTSVNK